MNRNSILKSAGLVGSLTMCSRVFGLFRDVTLAYFFGTAVEMSAFVVALRLPNLFRSLFGEGALTAAFVPVFTETVEKQGADRARKLGGSAVSALFLFLAMLCIAGIVFMSIWPGVDSGDPRSDLTVKLARIMFPYMVFICVAALLAAMLNALRHFATPAAAPIILNIAIIAAVWGSWLAGVRSRYALIFIAAGAVTASGALQMLVQLPALRARDFLPDLRSGLRDSGLIRVLKLMSITSIGMGVTRINIMIDSVLAMIVSASAPSYLFYAERIIYLPIGVFATALGTVLLPAYSRFAATADHEKLGRAVQDSMRQVIFVMLPAAVALLVLADPVVSLIYQRGSFTDESLVMTALALRCYALGLVFFGLNKTLVPAFYAMQDMKTPLLAGLAASILNLVLSLCLMWPFGHAGIALATAASAIFNAVILQSLLSRRLPSATASLPLQSFVKAAVAAAALGATAWCVNALVRGILPAEMGFTIRLLRLTITGICASLAYFGIAYLTKASELSELLQAFSRRTRRGDDKQ